MNFNAIRIIKFKKLILNQQDFQERIDKVTSTKARKKNSFVFAPVNEGVGCVPVGLDGCKSDSSKLIA